MPCWNRLPPETLATLREALLIGLAAYGEIDRLSDAQEINVLRILE